MVGGSAVDGCGVVSGVRGGTGTDKGGASAGRS